RKEKVAARLVEQAPTKFLQGMAAAFLSPHRQGVEQKGGESATSGRLEEHVSCGDRKQTIMQVPGDRRGQRQRVEMAGMIGDENERWLSGDVFAPMNPQAMP